MLANEIEITEAVLDAGIAALRRWIFEDSSYGVVFEREIVREIFEQMIRTVERD